MSGKSSVGKLVAEELSWRHVDLDREIEKNYQEETKNSLTCREIYSTESEESFRHREKEVLAHLAGVKNVIISLGGGTLNHPDSRKIVRKMGVLVYLKEDPEVLLERILSKGPKGLPAYLNSDDPRRVFLALAHKRQPIYEREAGRIIEVNKRHLKAVVKEFLDGL